MLPVHILHRRHFKEKTNIYESSCLGIIIPYYISLSNITTNSPFFFFAVIIITFYLCSGGKAAVINRRKSLIAVIYLPGAIPHQAPSLERLAKRLLGQSASRSASRFKTFWKRVMIFFGVAEACFCYELFSLTDSASGGGAMQPDTPPSPRDNSVAIFTSASIISCLNRSISTSDSSCHSCFPNEGQVSTGPTWSTPIITIRHVITNDRGDEMSRLT